MKKLNKILLLVISLFSFTLINVNATTYTNNKKINFKEFSEPVEARGLFNYEGKTYLHSDVPELIELIPGEKLSTKMSDKNFFILDEKYPNEKVTDYMWNEENGGLTKYTSTITGRYIGHETVELKGFPVMPELTKGDMWFNGYYNNKLYLIHDIETYNEETDEDERIDMFLSIYDDKEYKLQKTLKFSELVKDHIGEDVELWDFYLGTYETFVKEDPIIVAEYRTWDEKKGNLYNNALIFDIDGNLLIEIKNEDFFESLVPVFSEGKLKIAYVTYAEEYSKSSLKVTDGQTVETILKSPEYMNVFYQSGIVYVSGDKNVIYDNDFNLIKEYKDVDSISVVKEKVTLEDFRTFSTFEENYKEIQNGNYLVTLDVKEENEYGYIYSKVVKSELMTVEDSKKTSISGYIKDSNGNPLKGYIVELHSTPRTYTTDKDGYFKFDNVEEGEHTLIVKDSNGKVLVTKELNVIEGTETKLDEDTLYFNPKDEGFNLNIKVDGDKLVVDSVDKGVKEPSKNIVEKLEEVVVPKTFDGIMAYILIFGTLIGTTIYLNKKNRRIKYTNIK